MAQTHTHDKIRRHVFHAVWAKACDAAGLKGVRVE
jgi:hypothetical protein